LNSATASRIVVSEKPSGLYSQQVVAASAGNSQDALNHVSAALFYRNSEKHKQRVSL